MIPFTRPYFPEEMREEILRNMAGVFETGRLMMGPYAAKAEAAFAVATGCKNAVSLNSATTGLQICLRFAEAQGKDVIVPAASFVTDAGAVLMEGGNVVFADCDPKTLALDPADLARKLTPDTAAIIWVHLTGYISEDYAKIQTLAKQAGALLIEDASHAHGAHRDGTLSGGFGDAGVFSFYPTKVVTSGTGGMLTTDREDIAEYAKSLRLFGKDDATGEIVRLGNDWFMDEIRACVAASQIERLQEIVAMRQTIAAKYLERLRGKSGLRLLGPSNAHAPSWYQFPVFLEGSKDSSAVIGDLKERGVTAKKIYKPLHHEPLFSEYGNDSLTGSVELLETSLCLPMMPDMTDQEIDAVCSAVAGVI